MAAKFGKNGIYLQICTMIFFELLNFVSLYIKIKSNKKIQNMLFINSSFVEYNFLISSKD